jgi:hypothetical protein
MYIIIYFKVLSIINHKQQEYIYSSGNIFNFLKYSLHDYL